jgi:hypothetical protein
MHRYAALISIAGMLGCSEQFEQVCPSNPARWVISPDSIDIKVGEVVKVTVTELTCVDRRKELVYPTMETTDTAIAQVSTTHRLVYGFKAGKTTLLLLAPSVYDTYGEDSTRVPVVVR